MFDKLKGSAPGGESQPISQSEPATNFGSVEKSPTASSSTASGNKLSKDVSIKGKVKLAGDISIDGKVEGEIQTKGVVTLNQNAVINAIITAGTVVVHGKIEGNIEASDRIELLRTAEVIGDIKAAVLKVDAGAAFIGKSTIGKSSSSPGKASSKPAPAPEKKEKASPVSA